jgi:hypothetical protein
MKPMAWPFGLNHKRKPLPPLSELLAISKLLAIFISPPWCLARRVSSIIGNLETLQNA